MDVFMGVIALLHFEKLRGGKTDPPPPHTHIFGMQFKKKKYF
jgi:hypothetical protein